MPSRRTLSYRPAKSNSFPSCRFVKCGSLSLPFFSHSKYLWSPIIKFTNIQKMMNTHPSHGIAQRFQLRRLFHMPVPSIKFSLRALIVFSVRSSCLLQWGTRPHFMVCITSSEFASELPAAPLPSPRRRITGACERGATLCLDSSQKRRQRRVGRVRPGLESVLVDPFCRVQVIAIQL